MIVAVKNIGGRSIQEQWDHVVGSGGLQEEEVEALPPTGEGHAWDPSWEASGSRTIWTWYCVVQVGPNDHVHS